MSDKNYVASAIRVFQEEAQSILDLIPSLQENDNFSKACKLMLNCKGKVILTGVGKSGHIATKIASTLASTGTQSFFVQAGEAAHGDLGMIGKDDVVIAISHSGEGAELKVVVANLKRRQIPLIAITGNVKSTLGKGADVTLDAHVNKEACPLNLAPTCSSTVELVLGDALAVALIEARDFKENDFALYHPGGALGRRLLIRVDDLMHKNEQLPVVSENLTIKDALIEMTQKGIGMVCIVDENNKLSGLYTDGDLRRTLEKEVSVKSPIKDVMTKNCTTTKEGVLAAEALAIMQNKKINGMVVINEHNEPIGAFNMHDLLKAGII